MSEVRQRVHDYNKKKVFLAARNTIFVIYKNMPVLQIGFKCSVYFYRYAYQNSVFCQKGIWRRLLQGDFRGNLRLQKMLESEISYEKSF